MYIYIDMYCTYTLHIYIRTYVDILVDTQHEHEHEHAAWKWACSVDLDNKLA
jgi:hypothetical protein